MHDPHAHPLLVCGAAGALVLLLTGCGNGALGDAPSKPLADEYGPGSRLCDLILPATTWENPNNSSSVGCKNVPPTHSAYSTGLTVVAIDTFDETSNGKSAGNYYIEDTNCDGKPFSGVTVFSPAFSPPDLRLAPGDVIDFLGSVEEFLGPASSSLFGSCYTLPEITGTLSLRFDGATPAPIPIKDVDLKSYDTARPYLGMLVKMTGSPNVVISAPVASSGRYSSAIYVGASMLSDVPHITNELYDLQNAGPALADQMTFKSVTGIVTYFYGFHIAPRSPADFEP